MHLITEEFKRAYELILNGLREPLLSAKDIKKTFGNSVIANQSVPAAIYLAFKHIDQTISALHQECIEVGGDVDTIGAISSFMWGAVNGFSAIPAEMYQKIEEFELIHQICKRFIEEYE